MELTILEKFQKLYEKQDILSKLNNDKIYSNIGYSEIHSLVAIKDLDNPNLTKLSKEMNMTLGAISKIVKKLQQKNLVEIIKKENNKKEKYLILTEKGNSIYNEHEVAHNKWKIRDLKFLNTIEDNDREVIDRFLDSFNEYLQNLIEEN